MKKRGEITITSALSLILGVLALIILFSAGSKVYANYVDQESENAKSAMDSLEGKIDALKSGDENVEILFRGIKGWDLIGWSAKEEGRPDKCALESCICMCPHFSEGIRVVIGVPEPTEKSKRAPLCQSSKAICRDFPDLDVEIEEQDASFNFDTKSYVFFDRDHIEFDEKNIFQIFIDKSEDKIRLEYSTSKYLEAKEGQ